MLRKMYNNLYGHLESCDDSYKALEIMIEKQSKARSNVLKQIDKRDNNWYMSEKMVGMMLYVDLFSNDLKHLKNKIPYLKELGITYVHLMPLLKARPGENDGGYAVEDYLDIDSNLGTLNDFIQAVDALRKEQIDVCIDFVMNHTSDSHAWAKAAVKGDKEAQDMYIMYDTREIPDLYDETVPFVLPLKCPGNFHYQENLNKWIFSSFSDFQWDLNFANPKVFNEIVNILLTLANYGVTIIRLDAIAFIWKELGTSCRNLKQAHQIIEMLHVIKEEVCPSLALLGEAIVEPDEIVKYFGLDNKECGLLYNANLMVNVFHTFATRDTSLLEYDQMKFKSPNDGCFVNYVRCHDDIGWGLNEAVIASKGNDPKAHKRFLNDFYSGVFKGSFSEGEIYQYNPINDDARINGTLASLLGLEKHLRLKDRPGIDESISKILLAHGLIMFEQGIPLIYSGDELGQLNDHAYLLDDHKKDEGRWLHRPKMDWKKAENRLDDSTIESKVFHGITQLIDLRKSNSLFHASVSNQVIVTNNKHIYLTLKRDCDDYLIGLYNFTENNQYLDEAFLRNLNIQGIHQDIITGKEVDLDQELRLYPYEFLWLKSKDLPN